MCAAPMPSLAHIFRGTFIHSTWTSPMEVLRDHLLGVSDSGKVSGRGVRAHPDGRADRWKESRTVRGGAGICSALSGSRGSGVELEGLTLGERRENPGARFVGWPGSNTFPEAGSCGVRTPTIG